MEDKEKLNSKRDILDDSNISITSDINFKKFEEDKKEPNNKLEIIEEETKNYLEDMKKGTYNIMVAVRCRPLWNKEKEFSDYEIVKILDRKMVILMDPYEYNGPNDIFKNRSREQTYAFDFAFDKSCSQQTVFSYTTKFLLEGVVNGYNATVFAYGATGAGKTYTMLGTEDNPGIMPLTLQELFNKIEEFSSEREYKVKLWYIEIYNENIRDLLSNSDDYLDLREDPTKGVSIANISELNVTSCGDIMQILKRGNKNRTQEATNANETSSRSHAILQVIVEHKDKVTGLDAEIKIGKLSLIDLAGSERASATQNRGIRLIEGANINRSLLTLGNCINALFEASEKGSKPYVPYRDSKLTRLLKDSLGGNSRTVMIANVSPSVSTFDDTYNTLKYANRAKNIKTQVHRNVLNVQYHISNYNTVINNLKNEIGELKLQLAKANSGSGGNTNINVRNYDPMKKEETKDKDSLKTNVVSQSLFERCLNEVNSHCEEEIALKFRIIELEQHIYNQGLLINCDINPCNITNLANNEVNPNAVNIQVLTDKEQVKEGTISNTKNQMNNNPLAEQQHTIENHVLTEENYEMAIEEDGTYLVNNSENSVRLKEKEQLVNIQSNYNTNQENILTYNNYNSNSLPDLKKTLESYLEKFKQLTNKRGILMNNFYKLGVKEFHFDYLQTVFKAHNSKLQAMEYKFREKVNEGIIINRESHIQELESQLRLRDEFIKHKGLFIDEETINNLISNFPNLEPGNGISNISFPTKVKTVDQIKQEYLYKLPPINNGRELPSESDNSKTKDYKNIYATNLPQIGSGSKTNHAYSSNLLANQINAIMSDVKQINSNMNKLDVNYFKEPILKRDRSKLKGELLKDAVNRANQIRNYSQGVRNANKLQQNYQNYQINNLNTHNNQSYQNKAENSSYLNNPNYLRLPGKNNSAKIYGHKHFNSNYKLNIEQAGLKYNKDSNSDKSLNMSNQNISERENSDLIDRMDVDNQINNISDEDVSKFNKKRNNHFKDNKKLHLHNESPSYVSPYKKDSVILNKLNRREDSINQNKHVWNDFQPQIKKKDLNVFLNDKHLKFKNQKKTPFKI